MKRLFLFLIVLHPAASWSQATLVTENKPQAVFAGSQSVRAMFQNSGTEAVKGDLRFRLYQASASTLMPLGESKAWKAIDLPAGQTVVEKMTVDLPPIRGETAMHLVWFDGQRKLGSIRLQVFPPGLLKPLATLAGDSPLALLDVENHLKPAFEAISIRELKDSDDLSSSEASLVIIAPVSPEHRPAGLKAAVRRKAESGAGIVWIQPATRVSAPTYVLSQGSGRIVVADAEGLANFTVSPLAQLALVQMAELAAGRRNLELPPDPQP